MRGDGLMNEVIEGKMECKRVRGRKHNGMVCDLREKEWYGDLQRRAKNRQELGILLPGT